MRNKFLLVVVGSLGQLDKYLKDYPVDPWIELTAADMQQWAIDEFEDIVTYRKHGMDVSTSKYYHLLDSNPPNANPSIQQLLDAAGHYAKCLPHEVDKDGNVLSYRNNQSYIIDQFSPINLFKDKCRSGLVSCTRSDRVENLQDIQYDSILHNGEFIVDTAQYSNISVSSANFMNPRHLNPHYKAKWDEYLLNSDDVLTLLELSWE
jgi:hypothetical protein